MAQVKQVGVGRKTTGTIDGITYYVLNGKTYARSAPNMPASAYSTTEARIRQAIFKFIQMHLKLHLRTIRQTITPKNGSPSNRYYSLNHKALSLALQTLAEQYVDGLDVTITEVETAISAYATEHPKSIMIASKSGYADVYLSGPWPETITLRPSGGDSTVIIIVSENGTTTTINADGTVTTGQYQGSNGSSGSSGSNTDNGQQGGVEQSGNPRLTISRSGSGTSTVTVGGNTVNSGAELAVGTEVSLSVTPEEDAMPTATLNGNSVVLTESDGVYSGSFTMPSTNATLIINTSGTAGNSDGDDEN